MGRADGNEKAWKDGTRFERDLATSSYVKKCLGKLRAGELDYKKIERAKKKKTVILRVIITDDKGISRK